jgi:hypothetical protein
MYVSTSAMLAKDPRGLPLWIVPLRQHAPDGLARKGGSGSAALEVADIVFFESAVFKLVTTAALTRDSCVVLGSA